MVIRVLIGLIVSLFCVGDSPVQSQESSVVSGVESSPEVDPRLQHMMLIPAGEFRMGSLEGDKNAESDESPQRVIDLPDFYIDKLEVSNIDYKRFTDATSYPTPENWEDGEYPYGTDFYPVSEISWWEATAYARWVGKRLPTEAEWEKAARGTDARRYPWGDKFDDDLANVSKSYEQVASYFEGASPYQVLNMAGNVAEWTASAYAPYPHINLDVTDAFGGTASASQQPALEVEFREVSDKELGRAQGRFDDDDPLLRFFTIQELADRRDRVYRGGSVNNYSRFLRCANRQKSNPSDTWYNVGFRCAMDPPAKTRN